MANITVKNIPDDVYAKIKEAAKEQHRSVNSYLIDMMATKAKLVSTRSHIAIHEELRKLRERIGPLPQSLADSLREIRDGRDAD